MPDYSLVPVDYQPDFGDYSLVPVDYDPFSDEDATQQARTQPSQPQPQSQPQPVPSAQPTPPVPAGSAIGGGSSSPFIDFFNQLSAPERAQSEGSQTLCGIIPPLQRLWEQSVSVRR